MPKLWMMAAALAGTAAGCRALAADPPRPARTDLELAEAHVAASDRYLHQDKLRRGMTGYGLTVMAGTKIERFDATVVSVLKNWFPGQDVVLCRLSGLKLPETGIISGMSGSPVYVTDPSDGKAKMIGAVAYGWSFPKEAICGVQPIAQMLAVSGVPLPGRKERTDRDGARRPGEGPAPALDEDFVRAVLDPRKLRFAEMVLPRRRRPGRASDRSRLRPLATPLMVGGAGEETLRLAERFFAPSGLAPIRAGAVGGAEARAARGAKLAPGMAVSIPLAGGDADWAAVGTVTEVIGDHVLIFGHAFNAEGPVRLPMGPAYVHAVIPSAWTSFKIGSTLKVTGALTDDEMSGCAGRVGGTAPTTPMRVRVRRGGDERVYRYRLARHRRLTAALAYFMLSDSVLVRRELPVRHTVTYAVEIDFGELGTYRTGNVSSANGLWDVSSDVERPISALMNTGLGPPAAPERIDVSVEVRPTETTAEVLDLRLERNTYRPGETVRGRVTLRPFRAERIAREVAVELPEDLPDGTYTLTVCDAWRMLETRRSDRPHRYRPRTVGQLFEALGRVVAARADRLYAHVALPAGGLAVRKQELRKLPESLAGILARAAPVDANAYRLRRVAEVPVDYVVNGSAEAGFRVRKEPRRNRAPSP